MLLIFPGMLQAHNKREDDLRNQLSLAQTDSARVNIICELSDNYTK